MSIIACGRDGVPSGTGREGGGKRCKRSTAFGVIHLSSRPVERLQRSKSTSWSGELAAKAALICLVTPTTEMVASKSLRAAHGALICLVADARLIIRPDAEPALICLVAAFAGRRGVGEERGGGEGRRREYEGGQSGPGRHGRPLFVDEGGVPFDGQEHRKPAAKAVCSRAQECAFNLIAFATGRISRRELGLAAPVEARNQ
jgi:hypothetical protein